MKPLHVTFFGDSICVGQYVSIHSSWVARISAALGRIGAEHGYQVVVSNASANGRTTRQALECMAYEVQSQPVDVLIVQFGMNDCNYWRDDFGCPRVSPKAFAANLEEIFDRAFASGVQRILLNTNHPSGRDTALLPHADFTYEDSNRRYNQVIRDVAACWEGRVIFNDVEPAFTEFTGGDRERVLELIMPEPDLLHLSEKGHDLYFSVVFPHLKAAVEELIREWSA